jgi:hypothetical protein
MTPRKTMLHANRKTREGGKGRTGLRSSTMTLWICFSWCWVTAPSSDNSLRRWKGHGISAVTFRGGARTIYHKERQMRLYEIVGLCGALLLMGTIQAQTIKTGPSVGQTVPKFSTLDQANRSQTLKSVMGPKGVMLVFFRSADW